MNRLERLKQLSATVSQYRQTIEALVTGIQVIETELQFLESGSVADHLDFDSLAKECCAEMRIAVKDFWSKKRDRPITITRGIFACAAYGAGAKKSEISRYLKLHHTSVHAYLQTIPVWVSVYPEYSEPYKKILEKWLNLRQQNG